MLPFRVKLDCPSSTHLNDTTQAVRRAVSSSSVTPQYMATFGIPSSTRETRTLQVNCCVYPLNVHLNNITSITATAVIEVNRGDANDAFCVLFTNLCILEWRTINRKWCFSPDWFFHPASCPRLAWNILDLLWIDLIPDAKPQLLSCLLTTESGP